MSDYNLGTAKGIIEIEYKGQGAKKAAADVAGVGRQGKKSASDYEKSSRTISRAAGGIGLAAAAGLAVIIGTAARFESAMSRVDAATHASTGELNQLREASIAAGARTVFSASEAADAVTELAKAGVSTGDILGGALNGALDLASAGELGVAQAAEIAATTLNQFGLDGSQAGHVADVLAASAGKAQGEVSDMAAALKYVGPVASQMGISLEETAGSIAYLATQGIVGEQAGTSLRGMLTSLTSPSKVARDEMDALGISLYDAKGNFIGLRGVAGQLQETLGELTNQERDEALGRIFGNEQITAARILYSGGTKAIDDWTKSVDASGYAQDTAARKLNNLKGDAEQLSGSLETLFISMGSGSQGPLRILTQNLTSLVNTVNNLPAPVQESVVLLLGLTAAAGGLIFAFIKVKSGIDATRIALEGMNITVTRGQAKLVALNSIKFAGLLAALQGVKAIIDNLNPGIKESDLQRNLESLASGGQGGDLNKLADDIARVNSKIEGSTEFFGEAASAFGLFGDTNLDKAQKQLESVDQALASMVESGKALEAQDALEALAKLTFDKTGTSIEDTTSKFKAYQTAIDNAALSGTGAKTSVDGLAVGLDGAGNSAQGAAAKMEELTDQQLKQMQDAASKTANGIFNLGDSLDDSKVSLDGWISDLASKADALNNFTKNVQTAGRKGLREGLTQELEDAGEAGAVRLAQLAKASKSQIAKANAAWDSGQAAIQRYTDMRVPTKEVYVNNLPAKLAIHTVETLLNGLQDKTVTIRTNNVTTYSNRNPDGSKNLSRPDVTGEQSAAPKTSGASPRFSPSLVAANSGKSSSPIVVAPRTFSGGSTASGSSGATSSRIISGKLSIDASGQAFISGVAQDVVDGNNAFAGTAGRRN